MQKNKCPVCGHFTYEEHAGKYEGYKKVTSNWGHCSNCGFFFYKDYSKYSLEKQAEKYKESHSEWR